jgi:hypothetical protein
MVSRALFLLLLCAGVAQAEPEIRFVDRSEEWGVAGIDGFSGDDTFPDLSYVNGSGIAVGDVDGDGRMDFYYVQGARPNLLFLNRGDHFEESAESYGVADAGRGAGAIFCDLNGDRFPELLLSYFGSDRYFLNVGGERFELQPGFADDGMGMGMAVADFNGDGWGDVYLARYVIWPELVPTSGGACQWKGLPVICGPEAYRPQDDRFYQGGPGGELTLVSPTPLRPFAPGRGMGITVLDIDDDCRPEIYVANDASDNFLFRNEAVDENSPSSPTHWTELALGLGCALSASGKAEAGMGVNSGDVDGDGHDDLIITNFDGQTHALYLWREEGWYEEGSRKHALAQPSLRRLSWGAQLADFDNDGDLDLHVVNGHLYSNADDIGDGTVWRQPDDLFVNDGAGIFRALDDGWDGVEAHSGRGSAVMDFDDDGLLDLLVWNLGGPLRLLHNESSGTGGWLRVGLARPDGMTEASLVGTRASVELDESRVAQRLFRRGSGYLSCNDPRLHFGLGIDGVESSVVRIRSPHGDQEIELERGQTHRIRVGAHE